MGSSATKPCPTCNGNGTILVKKDVGAVAAAAGATIGGLLGGPAGAVVGGMVGLAKGEIDVQETCSQCKGWGQVDDATATATGSHPAPQDSHTPRGWHRRGGKMMTMYHGTSHSAAQSIVANGFNQSSSGMLGRGVYVSADVNKAERYGNSILKLEVKLGKTKKITSQGDPMRTSWQRHGYDSAWVPANCGMVGSGLTETCVFDPNRIRVLETL